MAAGDKFLVVLVRYSIGSSKQQRSYTAASALYGKIGHNKKAEYKVFSYVGGLSKVKIPYAERGLKRRYRRKIKYQPRPYQGRKKFFEIYFTSHTPAIIRMVPASFEIVKDSPRNAIPRSAATSG